MPKQESKRRCIVTGEVFPQSELLRFVADPQSRVVPDIKGNLPGRGMWLLPKAAILQEAIDKKLFSRASRQQAIIDGTLIEKTGTLLLQQALNYLSRARMAKELVNGFEKVSAAVQAGNVAVLIHAGDASADGCGKLNRLASEQVRIISWCDRETLAQALNLPNPVHIALPSGGLSSAFLSAYERWAGFQQKDRL